MHATIIWQTLANLCTSQLEARSKSPYIHVILLDYYKNFQAFFHQKKSEKKMHTHLSKTQVY